MGTAQSSSAGSFSFSSVQDDDGVGGDPLSVGGEGNETEEDRRTSPTSLISLTSRSSDPSRPHTAEAAEASEIAHVEPAVSETEGSWLEESDTQPPLGRGVYGMGRRGSYSDRFGAGSLLDSRGLSAGSVSVSEESVSSEEAHNSFARDANVLLEDIRGMHDHEEEDEEPSGGADINVPWAGDGTSFGDADAAAGHAATGLPPPILQPRRDEVDGRDGRIDENDQLDEDNLESRRPANNADNLVPWQRGRVYGRTRRGTITERFDPSFYTASEESGREDFNEGSGSSDGDGVGDEAASEAATAGRSDRGSATAGPATAPGGRWALPTPHTAALLREALVQEALEGARRHRSSGGAVARPVESGMSSSPVAAPNPGIGTPASSCVAGGWGPQPLMGRVDSYELFRGESLNSIGHGGGVPERAMNASASHGRRGPDLLGSIPAAPTDSGKNLTLSEDLMTPMTEYSPAHDRIAEPPRWLGDIAIDDDRGDGGEGRLGAGNSPPPPPALLTATAVDPDTADPHALEMATLVQVTSDAISVNVMGSSDIPSARGSNAADFVPSPACPPGLGAGEESAPALEAVSLPPSTFSVPAEAEAESAHPASSASPRAHTTRLLGQTNRQSHLFSWEEDARSSSVMATAPPSRGVSGQSDPATVGTVGIAQDRRALGMRYFSPGSRRGHRAEDDDSEASADVTPFRADHSRRGEWTVRSTPSLVFGHRLGSVPMLLPPISSRRSSSRPQSSSSGSPPPPQSRHPVGDFSVASETSMASRDSIGGRNVHLMPRRQSATQRRGSVSGIHRGGDRSGGGNQGEGDPPLGKTNVVYSLLGREVSIWLDSTLSGRCYPILACKIAIVTHSSSLSPLPVPSFHSFHKPHL